MNLTRNMIYKYRRQILMCGIRAAEELWRRQNLINLSKKLEIFWHIYLPLNQPWL